MSLRGVTRLPFRDCGCAATLLFDPPVTCLHGATRRRAPDALRRPAGSCMPDRSQNSMNAAGATYGYRARKSHPFASTACEYRDRISPNSPTNSCPQLTASSGCGVRPGSLSSKGRYFSFPRRGVKPRTKAAPSSACQNGLCAKSSNVFSSARAGLSTGTVLPLYMALLLSSAPTSRRRNATACAAGVPYGGVAQ